ncbi:MAG: beta-N-acetylhexosaminidase [Chitinophagaceae bacterium]|nr:beta-N-acetylhexosaminidase [Chitinophagaceae bacterium]
MVIHFRIALFGILLLLFTAVESGTYAAAKPARVAADPASRLLPAPQKVALTSQTISLTNAWTIAPGVNIAKDDIAITDLMHELKRRFNLHIKLQSSSKTAAVPAGTIRFTLRPGSVAIGAVNGYKPEELKKQAYHIKLSNNVIDITANAPAGLFYGVQSLLQLVQEDNDKPSLPQGEITDWPDLELRMIYWDDAHHLERLAAMKRAISQAAHYKINAIALKLEGHFQYKDAKPIVEPYAYTPAEYQELTDYAKKRHIELIPFLDAPGHVSFILKHPEYAHLRAYPDNNYHFSAVNPKVDELLLKMYDNLMEANKGVKYIFLSTDEAYYVGKPENEQAKARELGGNGRLWAYFVSRIANELHKKGREVFIWGEYPLEPEDIPYLPSHVITGVYHDGMAHLFKKQGIRQLVYASAQGMEPLFPTYYSYPPNKFIPADGESARLITDDEMAQGKTYPARVGAMLTRISKAVEAKKSDYLGTVIPAWGDSGLHPESFWLGYATGSAIGWNRQSVTGPELTNRFYHSFYGPDVTDIDRVYQLLSAQAQFWKNSWDTKPLMLRTPILGSSSGIFDEPRHLSDHTLSSLPIPSAGNLSLNKDWTAGNAERLKAAKEYLAQNSELLNLLHANIRNARPERLYNFRVFLSIAQLCRQELNMLIDLERINSFLQLAAKLSSSDPSAAVAMVDQALDQAKIIRNQRNKTYQSLVSVWYEDWFPKVLEANGRVFLDRVDDIKDHIPVRTADMSYLIYRQLHYPLGQWAEETQKARNEFAAKNGLSQRTGSLNWKDAEQLD